MPADETKDRLRRILALIPLAGGPDGTDLLDLQKYLGCGMDEIVRDVQTLIMCGVPPYLPSDYVQAYVEDGRLFINFPGRFRRPVRLSAEEQAAMQCALMQAEQVVGRGGAPGARSLMRRLARTGTHRDDRAKDYVHCALQVKIPPDKRAALQQAIDGQKELLIEYHSLRSGATAERIVRPYALLARSHRWYLIAHDIKYGRAIPFRGDRIRRAALTGNTFRKPEDFDLGRFLEGKMYIDAEPTMRVKVRFGPDYARFIAERFPPETLRRRRDGSLDLWLDTDSLRWAAGWVLEHGPYATAQDPPDLRREIVRACDEILAAYE